MQSVFLLRGKTNYTQAIMVHGTIKKAQYSWVIPSRPASTAVTLCAKVSEKNSRSWPHVKVWSHRRVLVISIRPWTHSFNLLRCLPDRRVLLPCDCGERSVVVLFVTYTDYNSSRRVEQRGPCWHNPALRGMYMLDMVLHWDGRDSTTSLANLF